VPDHRRADPAHAQLAQPLERLLAVVVVALHQHGVVLERHLQPALGRLRVGVAAAAQRGGHEREYGDSFQYASRPNFSRMRW
jgi:hypothetical protein